MSPSLHGRTAIVTGAAQGIGLSIARLLVERGANVMFADADEAALEAGTSDYDTAAGPVRWFAGQMAERLAMANLLSATLDAFDRVDILVNTHRFVRESDPLQTDPAMLEDMLRQNMTAGLRLSQMVAKRMIRQAGDEPDTAEAGAIVNVSAIARQLPSMLDYSIACAAQQQATRGLALALAPHRIRVNGVAFASVMSHELKSALRATPGLRDRVIAGTPLARIAPPEELAETVLYLAGEGARFVTGQIVTVDGGRSLTDPVGGPLT